MSIEPVWLRKPKHKELVVASSKGWIVASTGELLVSVKDLDKKLALYLGTESVELTSPQDEIAAILDIDEQQTVIEVAQEEVSDDEVDALLKQVEEQNDKINDVEEMQEAEVVKPKRRGRPPKKKE